MANQSSPLGPLRELQANWSLSTSCTNNRREGVEFFMAQRACQVGSKDLVMQALRALCLLTFQGDRSVLIGIIEKGIMFQFKIELNCFVKVKPLLN